MNKKIIFISKLIVINSFIFAQNNFKIIENNGGAKLGYSPNSGIKIINQNNLKFKDLNKNGKLDKYEDWRLSPDERAKDLASKLSVKQIAGLMLYSRHQTIPSQDSGFFYGTYNNKPFSVSGSKPEELSDQQKKFLKQDGLRHILITSVSSNDVSAKWNNNMQEFLEGLDFGIPGNTSSDPRHNADLSSSSLAEFNAGAGGKISVWPDGLAMAATFEPKIVKQFGEIAAKEYRALGITTALSPQIDLGTEPRWYRIYMTFGESSKLTTDMARAYIDGFQTSYGKDEIKNGWGFSSVNAMVKHWPGGGAEEAGRDGHWAYGKFAVFPGNNFQEHIDPFVNGAFKLEGKTQKASAVMPYYTISYNQAKDGTNLGNGFSKYIITDLLREKYKYDEVVCTDWGITENEGETPNIFKGKPWGAEKLSVAERHYLTIQAGVDQFGGNNDVVPVLQAYEMGKKDKGEKFIRNRFEQSAIRLLRNIFRLGLFENPYLNPEETTKIVGNPDFMKAGYEAQLKSMVMLKNKNNSLPIKEKKKVYIPKMYYPSVKDWWGNLSQPKLEYPINLAIIKKYYDTTENPKEADFALVFVNNPHTEGEGYNLNDRKSGSNGYIPITLQYQSYTANHARSQSIAAGDPVIDPTITNRTYKDKTVTSSNIMDLRSVLDTKEMMGEKPVIVVANLVKPMIFSEFEKNIDAIIVRFGTSDQAVMDLVSGKIEPSGLLPLQMPENMETVEKQLEDVSFDMKVYTDSQGNNYDFGFGLNWNGIIKDHRTEKYKRK